MTFTTIDPSLTPTVSQNMTNILDNGGFEIWQRGLGTTLTIPAGGGFGSIGDRWLNANGGTSGSVTTSQETTNTDSSIYSVKVNVTAASGDATITFSQSVENNLAYAFKTLSATIRIKTTLANSVRIAISDYLAGTVSYSNYHSGSGNWETLSVTKTMGALNDGNNFRFDVRFGMMQSGDAKVGIFYADNAMLVVGPNPVAYNAVNPQEDLARCQRYYEKNYAINTPPGTNTGSFATSQSVSAAQSGATPNVYGTWISFKVAKFSVPAMNLYTESGVLGSWVWNTAAGAGSIISSSTTPTICGFVVTQQTNSNTVLGYGNWTADCGH